MLVEDCMIPCPMTVSAGEPLVRVASMIFHHRIAQLPVVDERNRLIGIITERDVLGGLQTRRIDVLTAADVMTPNPESVTPGTRICEAVDILTRKRYGALPVVVGDHVVGMLGAHDLLRMLALSQAAETNPGWSGVDRACTERRTEQWNRC